MARSLLDQALVGIRTVEEDGFPRSACGDRISNALEHVYEAMQSVGEAAAFRRGCQAALEDCRESLVALQFGPSTDPMLLAQMRLVAQAVGILGGDVYPSAVGSSFPDPDGRGVPRASFGVPRLIDRTRALVQPAVPLRDPPPAPLPEPDVGLPEHSVRPTLDSLVTRAQQSVAALEAEPTARVDESTPFDEPLAPLTSAAIEEVMFGAPRSPSVILAERAGDLFEELSMMSLMRQPDMGHSWRDAADTEARLLARVDALVACGVAQFPSLIRRIAEAPVDDPELTWGALMLHGMMRGDDSFDEVARLIAAAPLDDPEVLEATADAMSFMPHPRTEAHLHELLESDSAARRVLAYRALGRRRAIDPRRALEGIEDPTPSVASAAAYAVARAPGELSPTELGSLLYASAEEVIEAGFQAALLRAREEGPRRARSLVDAGRGSVGNATLYLALAGGPHDQERLIGACLASGGPAELEALGWYGSTDVMGFLIGRLRDGETDALEPLNRITGANLTESEPTRYHIAPDLPFTREPGAPEIEPVLSPDAALWQAWWDEYGEHAEKGVRYRWGHRFSLADLLWELDEAPFGPVTRWRSHLELCARFGPRMPFEPRSFALTQASQIAQIRAALEPRGARAGLGEWPRRGMR